MGSQRVRYDWAHVQNLLQHKNKRQFPFCWKVKTHQGTISITTQSNITLNYMNMISHNWMLKLSNSLFSFSIYLLSTSYIYFPAGSEGKESACNAGDPGSISGLERSSGEGNGNPLQYSCLENLMDGGAWQATAPWGRKESDTTQRLHFHSHFTTSTCHVLHTTSMSGYRAMGVFKWIKEILSLSSWHENLVVVGEKH